MTRTARRSQRIYSLPATPWSILKRKFSSRYRTLEEENDPESESASEATSADTMDDSDCSSERGVTTSCSRAFVRSRLKRRRSAEGDLKETRKIKLNGSAAKRFFQKIKQKFTSRKLRRNLKRVEVAPLLREDSLSGSDGAGPVLDFKDTKKKKSKRTKKSKDNLVPFQGTDTRPLLDEGDESDDETSSDWENEWEEKEEEINTDGGCMQEMSKDSVEIEVMSDKKKKQNDARRLRRQKKKVCFNCRQPGHKLSECPMPQTSATGICFKCGSASHTSKKCKAKVPEGQYPYAKCFICQEVGHLSSACPDNPKGLYPHGGCCKVCGSVEHLKSNCPERLKNQCKSEPWGSTSLVITNHHSTDAEDFEMDTSTSSTPVINAAGPSSSTYGNSYRPRPKVVNF